MHYLSCSKIFADLFIDQPQVIFLCFVSFGLAMTIPKRSGLTWSNSRILATYSKTECVQVIHIR